MSVEFNAISLPSLAQMRTALADPLPLSELCSHDRLPSWEVVTKKELHGETRWLLRCAEGGLMWVHIDDQDMAYRATVVANDEARAIWVAHLLDFTPEERAQLAVHLQPGASFSEALTAALGPKRVRRSFHLPERVASDGTVERTFVAHDGGVIRAHITNSETILRAEILRGADAWTLLQPLVDP